MTLTPHDYPPFPFSREIYHKLNDLAQVSDSFDQLTKIALLGDLLLDPTGHYHKALFIQVEHICRHLKGLPNLGNEPTQEFKTWAASLPDNWERPE